MTKFTAAFRIVKLVRGLLASVGPDSFGPRAADPGSRPPASDPPWVSKIIEEWRRFPGPAATWLSC